MGLFTRWRARRATRRLIDLLGTQGAWGLDHLDAARALLEKGADPNVRVPFDAVLDWSPLWAACRNGSAPHVRLLLDHGAEANANLIASSRLAVSNGLYADGPGEPTLALLRRGMDVRETALHAASAQDDAELIGLLLAHGADPTAAGLEGSTPLHHAAPTALTGRSIQALLDAGADPSARDGLGRQPFQCARLPLVQALLIQAMGTHPDARAVIKRLLETPVPEDDFSETFHE